MAGWRGSSNNPAFFDRCTKDANVDPAEGSQTGGFLRHHERFPSSNFIWHKDLMIPRVGQLKLLFGPIRFCTRQERLFLPPGLSFLGQTIADELIEGWRHTRCSPQTTCGFFQLPITSPRLRDESARVLG